MRQGIVGLAVVAALSAAGTAMADGQIWIGIDPQSTGNIYNGSSNGGAWVITNKGGYNGVAGGNRNTGDNTTSNSPSDRNLRYTPGGVEESFLTFCIERNEYIAGSGEYAYYTEIATTARFGGSGGASGGEDPISPVTALIYSEFRRIGANGNTSGLFGGALGATLQQSDTDAIQSAIWHSENEVNSVSGTAQAVYNWAVGQNPQGIGSVRVLRLWQYRQNDGQGGFIYSGERQDQLTLIPLPPAAWAGLSTLAGVGFIGFVRRRKQMA